MEKITLYTKQGSKFRQWSVWTEGATVVVEHGQWGGKLTQKRYDAEPKNAGRSNATTAEEQATTEAKAKVVKQKKDGYYDTVEEAADHVEFTPMKAHNSDDHKDKIHFPCFIQPKLNGQRLMIDKEGNAWSKQGEPLQFPEYWTGVKEAAMVAGGLDGEIYAGLESEGGLSLQKIISAFRKKNPDTPKLKLWVYDIPDMQLTFASRNALLEEIYKTCEAVEVVVVPSQIVNDWDEAVAFAKGVVELGYEGAILRNFDGMYEFGKRSYDLQKLKFRQSAEAVVVSVTQDKNGDGVLLCQAINGKQTGVQFECLMRKDADENINYRKYSNALLLVGKAITYEYEELREKLVPTKPVGIAVREMLGNEGRY